MGLRAKVLEAVPAQVVELEVWDDVDPFFGRRRYRVVAPADVDPEDVARLVEDRGLRAIERYIVRGLSPHT